jgi:prepilin-type N-terminal cleavage/methylation domain-containing protein
MHAYPLAKRPTRAGFTLIEMIGVMVVISILFAAAVPSVVSLIRTQRSVDDRAELPKIAAALKLGMLREQRFPLDMNASAAGTAADADYWWNLATRHGAGSANEARYPLGTIPGEANTRKLYFAKASWGGQSFFEITGDGSTWLADPLDPKELRLLLISTTNPDLSLPDVLTITQFNAFWNNWAVGNNGDPATGNWPNYGLSKDQWSGRAPELNIERIDLREWLSTVVIENRRAIAEASGADLSSALTSALGFWDRGSVSVSSTNLQDAEFIIQARDTTEDLNQNNSLDSGEDANGNSFLDSGEDLNGNGALDSGEDLDGDNFFDHPALIYTYVEAVIQTQRGRRLIQVEDPSDIPLVAKPATVTIRGRRSLSAQSITATLTLTGLAPIALINPNNAVDAEPLYDFVNDFGLIENRYFLKTQELLLGEPWPKPGTTPPVYPEVGIFTITENFSTLRFDGLQWHY